MKLNYRTFGKTNIKVSEVGLGTWQLGGSDWGDVSEADALAILRRAVDRGINFFDTADVYGGGKSETLIGKFLKETRGTVYVATKLGRRDGRAGWPRNFTLETVRAHTQDSLRRLGVEQIFLQQWHCIPTAELRRGEVFDHLRTIQKEGLIQHWGVSVESVEEGLICMAQPDCASLQVIFNVFRQKLAAELLPRAKATKTAILARVPLASGLLSGQYAKGHQFGEKDHRSYNEGGKFFNAGETFAGLGRDEGIALAQELKPVLTEGSNASLAQQALRWILDHDAVTTVIPGATKVAQVESNAAASDLPRINPAAHQRLQSIYREKIHGRIQGVY